ncbi:Hint domain-containing protein [Psychromarinibacter sp. S121]|uniref:Hint domain-containing protein n=1 Tax=Psychromarinibacter sp. S121 TaxID=3415127 RepID=UPI003C7B076D
MPVFDFRTTNPTQPGYSTVFTTGDAPAEHIADGIKFTLTFESGEGNLFFTLGQDETGFGPPALFFADSSNTVFPDVVRLTLESTANPANNVMSGTALNPVTLRALDYAAAGMVRVSFTDSRDGIGTVVRTVTNSTATLTAVGEFTGIVFTLSATGSDTSQTFTQMSVNAMVCYLEGTRIATVDGFASVEDLKPGNTLRRADGGETRVRWVGQRTVDPAMHAPLDVSPVRIAAGALGNGLPERDLLVSPKHGIAVDGALVDAAALVNGSTIRQVKQSEPFTYFHVETDAHELILAEGVPAETYLEQSQEMAFDNADTRMPRIVPEMDLPRITSRRLLAATAA